MKKLYTTPSVEKIAFRYRDQVVAASGTDAQGEVGSTSSEWTGGRGCGLVDVIVKVVETPGDWRLCNIFA